MSTTVVVDVFDRTRCELGEGPAWDWRTNEVIWVDILGKKVHLRGLLANAAETVVCPSAIGAVLVRRGEGWLVSLESGPAVLLRDGRLSALATWEQPDGTATAAPVRGNDAKCDPCGRCWLGTMAWDARPGAGSLYRLDSTASPLRRVLSGLTIANGLGWSPDGSTMYFIDTPTQTVAAYDYELGTGDIANPRPLVHVPDGGGSPDGMAVDSDGCLWIALWGAGAVARYTPAGTLDRWIPIPCVQVASCAFVGPHLDRLLVTTAATGLRRRDRLDGATFVLDPGVEGLPVSAFRQ